MVRNLRIRNTALWVYVLYLLIRGPDRTESSLDNLGRYHDQLVCLEQKIPASEIQIPFKWKDAFDRGSIFGGRISLTVSSLAYEKVCILFNYAALSTQVAESQVYLLLLKARKMYYKNNFIEQ